MEDVLALLNITTPYNDRISEIDSVMLKQKYKQLNLTIISTTLNYEKTTYIITPAGLKNSRRKACDGIVLFGYEKKNLENENLKFEDDKNNNEIVVNDFVFPIENKEDDDKNNLYEFPNFAIYYNIKDNNYYIKDFNTGVGALMKITKFTMGANTLINVGSNYLVTYIDGNKITIKIFNNNNLENKEMSQNYESFNFDLEQKNLITIGRSKKCDIVLEDMMLSKIQSTIEYNKKDECVYLYDGDTKKESTNATWVFILNPFIITNNFLFKAEHTLFAATINEEK